MSSDSIDDIDWNDVIGKEARGLGDADLGEVQEIHGDIVVTKSGIIGKKMYNIPKNLIIKYDGHKLWFNVSKEEAKDKFEVDA
jgi:hypothetical protein